MSLPGRWHRRLRGDLWLRDRWRLRRWRTRWWLWRLRHSRRTRLVEAIRGAAGASGRIVALITGAASAEADNDADRRRVFAFAGAAGALWWLVLQVVAWLLDRGGRAPLGKGTGADAGRRTRPP